MENREDKCRGKVVASWVPILSAGASVLMHDYFPQAPFECRNPEKDQN